MQHLCGVASMIVSPEGALSPEGDKAPVLHRDVAFALLYRTTSYHAVFLLFG